MVLLKVVLAAASATLVWFIANALGAEPRPLDWWILFSIGVVLRKKGYDA